MKYTGFYLSKLSTPFDSYVVIDDDNNVIGTLTHYESTLESTYNGKIVYSEEVGLLENTYERDRYYSLATWEIKKELLREKITSFNVDPEFEDLSQKTITRTDLNTILSQLCYQLEIMDMHSSTLFKKHITDWLVDRGYTVVYG